MSKNQREYIKFIGIGAPKSGTTWLAKCLNAHPEICCKYKRGEKEATFFNTNKWAGGLKGMFSNYGKGLDWYINQVCTDTSKVCGEISVTYLSDPKAPERIYRDFPKVKLIAVLREPVSMLYSFYNFLKWSVITEVPDSFDRFISNRGIQNIGRYEKNINTFLKYFPKDNIHIILFDDLKANPETTLIKLYCFLGISPQFVPSFLNEKENSAFIPRFPLLTRYIKQTVKTIQDSKLEYAVNLLIRNKFLIQLNAKLNKKNTKYIPLSIDQKSKYKQLFIDDINLLEKLIERDLSIWK